MRLKGTKYPSIEKLPAKALPVSKFAADQKLAVGYIYIKHQRHFAPIGSKKAAPYPGYIIRQFQGTNYVIPD